MMLAFDSNILIYMIGLIRVDHDVAKRAIVRSLIAQPSAQIEFVAPVQVLGEVFQVCQRKGMTREASRAGILSLKPNFRIIASSEAALLGALELATMHKLQLWDALILNAAAEAGCALLLSEDMQAGFKWRGVTVANPFADPLDPTLRRVLN